MLNRKQSLIKTVAHKIVVGIYYWLIIYSNIFQTKLSVLPFSFAEVHTAYSSCFLLLACINEKIVAAL